MTQQIKVNIPKPITITQTWEEFEEFFCIYNGLLCMNIRGSLYDVNGEEIYLDYDDEVELVNVEINVERRSQ